ncbi:MAG: GTPase [Cyanobacteria bacterium P01_D01_bin.105]
MVIDIKIGIVGHTNSGKTTLIRTLLRRPVGTVDDRANVTQLSTSEEFRDFFADLVDTPGFQNAAGYLAYVSTKEKFGDEAAQNIKNTIRLDYEEEVVKTVESCDACIYVVSLETVPDDTLLAEVNLISSLCDSLLVILNKKREFSEKDSKEEAERRRKLWIEGCQQFNVDKIIDYDAHWASPKANHDLFEEIANLLPTHKKQLFNIGLSKFESRRKALRDQSIEYALECIVKCRSKDLNEEMKALNNEDEESYIRRIKARLTEMCSEDLNDFLDRSTSLYSLAAELPTTGIDQLGNFTPSLAKGSRIGTAAIVATFIASVLGLAGAIVGLLAASITAASAAGVGGAVGGGLGAIIGFSGASGEEEKLKAIQAGYVAVICINVLWLLSCYGWGKGAEVPAGMLDILEERTRNVVSGLDPINWHRASSDEMKSWFSRFLDRIDS